MFLSKFNYSLVVSKIELFIFISRFIVNVKRNNSKYIVC